MTKLMIAVVAALAVVATGASAQLDASLADALVLTEAIGFNGLFSCFSLGINDDFYNTPPTDNGGRMYHALNMGEAMARVAEVGATVTAMRCPDRDCSASELVAADVAVFNQQNPIEDPDLGAPNARCGMVLADFDPALGFDARCWNTDTSQGLLGDMTGSFRGGNNNLVPFVNCSDPAVSCPGLGCGGGRYLATGGGLDLTNEGTRNNDDNGEADEACEWETQTAVVFGDSGLEQVTCPVLNAQANCVASNVIVIQETNSGNPDDNAYGGYINVAFDEPVSIAVISVVDVDYRLESGTIVYTLENGGTVSEPLSDPGNNGFESAFITTTELVTNVRFELDGSGSLSDLQWCVPEGNVTTTTTSRRECEWTIEKTVDPTEVRKLVGDSEDVQYTVVADRVCNDTYEACSTALASSISPIANVKVTSVTYGLSQDGTLTSDFDYEREVDIATECQCRDSLDGEFTDCVVGSEGEVELDSQCGFTQCEMQCTACLATDDDTNLFASFMFGTADDDGVADFRLVGQTAFSDDFDEEIDECATISDDDGLFVAFETCERSSETYTATATCDGPDPSDETIDCTSRFTTVDTATTGSSTASYDRVCLAPTVTKNATTSFRRCFDWTISKSGSSADGTNDGDCTTILFNGITEADVAYDISVTATPRTDSYEASGVVSVTNPHDSDSLTGSLSDSFTGGAVSLDSCTGNGGANTPASLTVGPLETVYCTWSFSADAQADGTNTATLSFNGYTFDGTADVAFGTVASSTCNTGATVSDLYEEGNAGEEQTDLGSYAVTDPASRTTAETFDTAGVQRTFAVEECEPGMMGEKESTYTNVATVTPDEGDPATDAWKVTVRSPCGPECPCMYEDFPPAGQDPMDDFCVSVSGPPSGVCLCWQ